jgi:hypothetical protein
MMLMAQRFAWAAAVLVAGATIAAAQPPKGEGVIGSTKVTATVTKIDQKTREVSVRTDAGKDVTFVADPAIKNLPQVKVGDVITATYTEALAYEVKKGGQAGADQTIAGGTAAAGQKPAGAIANRVTVTVKITAIDPSVPSVTFTGPAGNSRVVRVRDPEKLKGVSVGDTVVLTYTEAFAMKVEKAATK